MIVIHRAAATCAGDLMPPHAAARSSAACCIAGVTGTPRTSSTRDHMASRLGAVHTDLGESGPAPGHASGEVWGVLSRRVSGRVSRHASTGWGVTG